jgi:hypothetical protein
VESEEPTIVSAHVHGALEHRHDDAAALLHAMERLTGTRAKALDTV